MSSKFVFITGGVISGIGKGITVGSLGLILKSKGLKVTCVKCDPYLNVDAGTLNPTEHGEVFVCEDGIETDQDIGNYERALDENLGRENYITSGQIYKAVIDKERRLEYRGRTVEAVPHIPEEINRRIFEAQKKQNAEIVIVEIGGTVTPGELQNLFFLKAAEMLADEDEVIHIHLSYLMTPPHLGEMKTKPVQASIHTLNTFGIHPDFVVCRSENPLDEKRREKIARFGRIQKEHIISNPDVKSIYEVPLVLEEQELGEKVLNCLNIQPRKTDLQRWRGLVSTIKTVRKKVKIAIVGKYFDTGDFTLSDSYLSVIEAVKHAAWSLDLKPQIDWIDSQKIEDGSRSLKNIKGYQGIIVPGGFGARGTEGKIKAIQFCRKERIPYLGLCFGMQLAVVEFARNVMHLKGAHTTEINPRTPYPVIALMTDQKNLLSELDYGGTMRLGAYKCRLNPQSLSFKAYRKGLISERHRHRYEFNNKYRESMEKQGLVIGGINPERNLVEIVELPLEKHPFFVGVQFHPEFKSRPLRPHPLFKEFLRVSSS